MAMSIRLRPGQSARRTFLSAPPPPVPVGEWDVQVTGPNQITIYAMPTFLQPVAIVTGANQITITGEVEVMPTAFIIVPEANTDLELTDATVVAFTGLPQVINGIAAGSVQVGAYGVFDTPLTVSDPGVSVPVISGSLPQITGTLTVGSTVTLPVGTWSNSPTSYAVTMSNGATPSGTGPWTYVLQSGDIGLNLTHTVTATNAGGASSPATSAAYGPVAAAPAAVDLVSTKDWNSNQWVKFGAAAKAVEDGWMLGPDGNYRLDTNPGANQWPLPAGQTFASITGQHLTAVVDVANYGGNNTVNMDLRVFRSGGDTTRPFGVNTATGVAVAATGASVRPLASGYYRCVLRFDPATFTAGSGDLTRVFLDIPKTGVVLSQFSRPCLFLGNLTDGEIDALTASTTPRVPA